jgi:hypothetical protein
VTAFSHHRCHGRHYASEFGAAKAAVRQHGNWYRCDHGHWHVHTNRLRNLIRTAVAS